MHCGNGFCFCYDADAFGFGDGHAATRVHNAFRWRGSVALLAAWAQQPTMPVVAFIRDGSADGAQRYVTAFRKGLNETGYIESQNVTVEYHWLEGQYDRLQALLADLVRRQVAVIATPGTYFRARSQSCNSDHPDRVRHR